MTTQKSNAVKNANTKKAIKESKLKSDKRAAKKLWRKINLKEESFQLPSENVLNRSPTFNLRNPTLLTIFLRFITHELVRTICDDAGPESFSYHRGDLLHISMSRVYRVMAIWVMMYGRQKSSAGVRKGQRPLRYEFASVKRQFEIMYPNIPSMGITFLEVFTANFLIHSGYSEQLSKNFRSILRGIGNSIAGDEKLLHFTGIRIHYAVLCFLILLHR